MEFPDTRKQLLCMLDFGKFHSGSQLSEQLGVSRSAIWKQINAFKQIGVEINAVSGKGYRLVSALELLDKDVILAGLEQHAETHVSELIIHDVITSTNSYLFETPASFDSGTICLAEFQTAGKGRRGRQWVSPFGSNVYLSVLWQYEKGPAAISGLSLAAGVAVVRALEKVNDGNIGLKWPNDIYWNDKKLGGILVEVQGDAEGPCTVVVGIGMNMRLTEHEAISIDQAWTDMHQITGGRMPSRNQLIVQLLNQLIPIIAEFENAGIDSFIGEWRTFDCMVNRPVSLFLGNQVIEGVVQGVDENGLITLQLADGKVSAFASGEVSFNAAL